MASTDFPERIRVVAYSGYRGEEEPRFLIDGERRVRVQSIGSRWVEPHARCFRVRLEDGRRMLLRYNLESGLWSAADDGTCRIATGSAVGVFATWLPR